MSQKPTVFISYAHADSIFVDQLADDLKASGVNVWIDKWKIKVGDSITHRINEGIGASDFLIIALSRTSVKSKWVQEELNAALIRNIEQEKHAFILPILLEKCEIPSLLKHRKYADFTDNPEQAFQELLEVVRPAKPFEPEMILIPAGEFLMGSDPSVDKDAQDREQPQHTVYLPDYYMAKTPVTNAQFVLFVQTTFKRPAHWESGQPPVGKEDHPVVNVSWHDAVAYCNWLSKTTGKNYRLPTEAEWEKAARGTEGRIYPWGNKWDERLCNTYEGGAESTSPVGAYPDGASPYGVLDMAGNVWERCATKVPGDWLSLNANFKYKPYPYDVEEDEWTAEYLEGDDFRVERGGSRHNYQKYARCAFRGKSHRDHEEDDIGFRLVSPLSSWNSGC